MMMVKAQRKILCDYKLPHLHPLATLQSNSPYPVANHKPLTLYTVAISVGQPLYKMMRWNTSGNEKALSGSRGVWPVMESLLSTAGVGGPFSQVNQVFKRFFVDFGHLTAFLEDIISSSIYHSYYLFYQPLLDCRGMWLISLTSALGELLPTISVTL